MTYLIKRIRENKSNSLLLSVVGFILILFGFTSFKQLSGSEDGWNFTNIADADVPTTDTTDTNNATSDACAACSNGGACSCADNGYSCEGYSEGCGACNGCSGACGCAGS